MVIEILFKNGRKERVIASAEMTVVNFVTTMEQQYGSRIQSMRVVKRSADPNRGSDGSPG